MQILKIEIKEKEKEQNYEWTNIFMITLYTDFVSFAEYPTDLRTKSLITKWYLWKESLPKIQSSILNGSWDSHVCQTDRWILDGHFIVASQKIIEQQNDSL